MSSNSQIIRGFTAEQNHSFTNILLPALQAFDKHFNPLQPQQKQSVIMPKPAQQEQEQKHKPLQQANVEKSTEKSSDNKVTIIKNTAQLSKIPRHTLSIIPHQATMHNCGDPSPRLSSTPLSTSLLASLLTLASPLGYIRYAKDMEAIGQG
ncbi:hypothetical protein HO133_002972 [Letharia lupina]|uniref:Uncharacterized protein n=1 Tax=Letharia lupina TaxID=560253 RepID=A0A8H6CC52_9LECA|nr:uncharacterized protein HO133_002972 [Letharia lupina]KAF6220539.1 hypothetical protein HO133_002972 [Letharia lupina]